MKALLTNLETAERDLVRETERDRMAELDEDELIELHRRIRRARNKHVGIYRRGATERIAERGGRGRARSSSSRDAGKAEIFEDALARVSRRLSVVARQTATALKDERLSDARADRAVAHAARADGGHAVPGAASPVGPGQRAAVNVVDTRPPARLKREASTRATGARRQAKRDS